MTDTRPAAQPPDRTDGRTHWAGCWREHLPCAIARIHELESQQPAPASGPLNAQKSALDVLREWRHFWVGPFSDDLTLSGAQANELCEMLVDAPASGAEPDAWVVECRRRGSDDWIKNVRDSEEAVRNEVAACDRHNWQSRVVPLFRHPPASGTGSEDTLDAAKWRWFRDRAWFGTNEDGDICMSTACGEPPEADWLTDREIETLEMDAPEDDAMPDLIDRTATSFVEAEAAVRAARSPSDQGERT